MSEFDWLIVGGGIHGVHVAVRLLGEGRVAADRLTIVDPAAELLQRWRRCTATTGMTHLRSTSVHHLGARASSLTAFAGRKRRFAKSAFRAPYGRPSLKLFNAHCDHVVKTYGLSKRHTRSFVTELVLDDGGASVRLEDGARVEARQVVLAVGAGDHLAWPTSCPRGDRRFQHVFDPRLDAAVFEPGGPATPGRVAVLGGGITAAQIALRAHDAGHTVDVISNHAVRVHQFDSDPGWLGPKRLHDFNMEGCYTRRREMIGVARHRGSVPPDVVRGLERATAAGRLRWKISPLESVRAEDTVSLRLKDGSTIEVDHVLLATGFRTGRPGGGLLDDTIARHALPCAACGYPIVDKTLAWHPALYTTGPLAELELGPAARNIWGARRAADRLVAVARARA